jgi:hypothetical protein
MKTKKEIVKELLEAASEDKMRNEISLAYANLRFSEKQENRLLDVIAKLQNKIKEDDKFVSFLKEFKVDEKKSDKS